MTSNYEIIPHFKAKIIHSNFNFIKLMAQPIPSDPFPSPPPTGGGGWLLSGFCHLVGLGGGDLSENLCPWVGQLSILLEAVNTILFSIPH